MTTSFNKYSLYFSLIQRFLNRPICYMAVCISVLYWNLGFAQTHPDQNLPSIDTLYLPRIQHEVGLSAGLTIGSGLAYKASLRKVGMMLSLLPSWSEFGEAYLAGLSFYLVGYENANTKFFFYQGNHYMSTNRYLGSYESTSINAMVVNYNPGETLKDRNWNHGIGVGYEIFRGPGKFNPFGLSMMVGWASYKNFTETNISGELALMYKFSKNAHLQPKRMKLFKSANDSGQ